MIVLHKYETRDGLPVCRFCGMVKNSNNPSHCSGRLPGVELRRLRAKLAERDRELDRLLATLARVRKAADLEPCRSAVLEALGDG